MCLGNYGVPTIYVAAYTEWKVEQATILQPEVTDTPSMQFSKHSQIIASFQLSLTLTKRWADLPNSANCIINELILEEAAFQPKTYGVMLE